MSGKYLLSIKSRISSYYKYFVALKMNDYERVTADEIAEHFGYCSSSSVTYDMRSFIDNPGRKKYGYNVVFICNELKAHMGLSDSCNLSFIGNESFISQFNLIKDALTNSGFTVGDYITEPSKENLKDCQFLIIASHYDTDLSESIPDTVQCIYDLGMNKMVDYKGHLESFDLWENILKTWSSYSSAEE